MEIRKISQSQLAEQRYAHLKQIDAVYDKWKRLTNYFDKVPEVHAKTMAVILDNQQKFMDGAFVNPRFRKIALELTKKVFENFIGFDLVSFQPSFGPTVPLFYTDSHHAKDLVVKDGIVKTGAMKIRLQEKDYESDGFVDRIAQELRENLTREILTDLRNNIGTIVKRKFGFDGISGNLIFADLMEIGGILYRKTLRQEMRWMVCGSDIAKIIGEYMHIDFKEAEVIKKIGTLCQWNLYVDPRFPKNEILCGIYDPLLDGYIYSPYIFATETPAILDPELMEPSYGLLTRYAKYLIKPKAYAKIKYETENP